MKYTSVDPDCWNIEDPPLPPPEPVSTVTLNVEASPFVNVITLLVADAVTNKLLVFVGVTF